MFLLFQIRPILSFLTYTDSDLIPFPGKIKLAERHRLPGSSEDLSLRPPKLLLLPRNLAHLRTGSTQDMADRSTLDEYDLSNSTRLVLFNLLEIPTQTHMFMPSKRATTEESCGSWKRSLNHYSDKHKHWTRGGALAKGKSLLRNSGIT